MDHANARFGVLIFSAGDENLWDDLTTQEGSKASWTVLIPSLTANNRNLKKLVQRINSFIQ
jgi:hypothetical protein